MTMAPELPQQARRQAARPLPPAPTSRFGRYELTLGTAFITVVTLAMWAKHGGVDTLLAGGSDSMLGLAQVTGLAAALAALGGVVLVARPRWMERRYGLDRMLGWHRWLGSAAVILVIAHAATSLLAYGAFEDKALVPELWSLMQTERWMWAATLAGLLFVAIGITSYRRIRTRVHYETWYFIHLAAYVAVLLGFGHQLTLGTDFTGDAVARWWWIALFVITLAVVLTDRVGDLLRAILRGPMHVVAVTPESHDVASVTIGGPGLRRLRASAGQYFLLRFGHGDLIWQAHPVSLSAAPTRAALRFTVKRLGDGSEAMHGLTVGTRAYLEGPYGRMTAARADGEPVLLVAGGVGIAPLRAVLEDCTAQMKPVLIVRVRDERDFVHRREVEELLAERDGTLYLLAGPRRHFGGGDPFHPDILRSAVPDLGQRHVYICGPESLERAVEKSVRQCGVPLSRIHVERFGV